MSAMEMLTDTAAINDIKIGDRTVELVGYVDALQLPITVGTSTRTVITKFVLNNGEGRRVQCVAWGRLAAIRTSELLRMRMILRIDGATARPPRYENQTNVPLEIRIDEFTALRELGEYPMPTIIEEIDNPIVPLVELNDVANVTGRIKIQAFLKSPFNIKVGNRSSCTVGVITDGFFKLEVQRAICTPLDIEPGESIEVMGTIYEDPTIHLQLRDDSEIRKLNDGERIPREQLLNITKLPQKKTKVTKSGLIER